MIISVSFPAQQILWSFRWRFRVCLKFLRGFYFRMPFLSHDNISLVKYPQDGVGSDRDLILLAGFYQVCFLGALLWVCKNLEQVVVSGCSSSCCPLPAKFSQTVFGEGCTVITTICFMITSLETHGLTCVLSLLCGISLLGD